MDKLRIAKVDGVLLQKGGESCQRGTLHLTQHHLIFSPEAVANRLTASEEADSSEQEAPREIWLPYSLLWLVTRQPSLLPLTATSRRDARLYPLLIRLRNFETLALAFDSEATATDVWESVKACAVVSEVQDMYAFFYTPGEARSDPNGWQVYNFKREFARQGVGSRTKAWRYCDINMGYAFCPTYPAMMCVPSRISDATLRYASKYRSKARIPALSYLHWANMGTITRSSQPMVGLNNRSLQDEKLIEAIFTSHHFADPHSPTALAAAAASAQASGSGGAANVALVYGAQATNLIVDARPTANAQVNRARGAGTENMEHYKGCKKAYLGVDNIHVMRDSLHKLSDALRDAEHPVTFAVKGGQAAPTPAPPLDYAALKRSGWLKHISALLEGTLLIARNVHINSSHVLIHCSDGWDRTSQLSALAQICLDPYFRTLDGLAVLVEKDWCSFGFRFWDRCGHAGSPKYFTTASRYGEESDDDDGSTDGADAVEKGGFEAQSQAAANAFWGFTKSIANNFQGGGGGTAGGPSGAHLKEISPVFHQWLDCIWQLRRQFPQRFEYNDDLLIELHTQLYECRFGTFLANSEREARTQGEFGASPPAAKTVSIWDAILAPANRARWIDANYDAKLDDPKRDGADMGVLLPNSQDVRYFARLYRRGDEEMNAGIVAEIEERRRAIAAAEAARSAQAAAAAAAVLGTSEAGPSALGAVVEAGSMDPGLNGPLGGLGSAQLATSPPQQGGVDRVEASGLAYKPRVPRAARQGIPPSSSTASLQPSAPAPQPPRGNSPAANSLMQQMQGDAEPAIVSPSAAEAAARMKGMFVSGWGRLQAAYNDVTAIPEASASQTPPLSSNEASEWASSSSSAKSGLMGNEWADAAPSPPSRVADRPAAPVRQISAASATSSSARVEAAPPLPPAKEKAAAPSPAPAGRAVSNPWAAAAPDPLFDGLPSALASTSISKPKPREVAKAQPPVPAPVAAAPQAEQASPAAKPESAPAAYDPLGVL